MSLPEQGAKVASNVIEALRAQPLMLAVIVLNMIIFLAIAYSVREQRKNEHEIIQTLLDRCITQRSAVEMPH